MKQLHPLLLTALLLTGCMDAKIDASTAENLKNSIASVRSSLDENKQKEFDKALGVVTIAGMSTMLGLVDNQTGSLLQIKNQLDGKTADDIIGEANRILAEKEKNKGPKFTIGIGDVNVRVSTQRDTSKKPAGNEPGQ